MKQRKRRQSSLAQERMKERKPKREERRAMRAETKKKEGPKAIEHDLEL